MVSFFKKVQRKYDAMFSKVYNMSGSILICASRGNLTCYVGSSQLKGGSGSLLNYAMNGHDDQG